MRPHPALLAPGIALVLAAPARAEERLHPVDEVAPPSSAALAQEAKPGTDSKPEPAKTVEQRLGELEKSAKDVVSSAAPGVKVTAMLDAAFTWNFADPIGRRRNVNVYRANDPDHDSFEITWAKLGVARAADGTRNEWDAGLALEIGAGREAQNTISLTPGFLFREPFNFAQAYVELQAPTPYQPVLIRFGRQYAYAGIETLDSPLNPNYSFSFLNAFTPFTLTGVSVGMDLGAGFRYTQYVLNGWDLLIDDNDAKTFGGQLLWKREDPSVAVTANWMWGPERDDDDRNARWFVELDASFSPIEETQLRAALLYGQEQRAHARTGNLAKFGGAELIFRQELLEVEEHLRRFAFALRAGYFRDQGGSRTGVDQALLEQTATFEVHFTQHAKLRVEYRHDTSTRDVFFGHRRPDARSYQDTVSIDAAFAF